MKKFILLAVAAIFVITSTTAQEKGQWSVGPKIGIYTHTGGGAIFGLGAIARYNITDAWRIEPGITALFKSGCSVDINCDIHYLFELGDKFTLYPLAGLSASDIGKWGFGINLGAGADYKIADHWDLSAGVKWLPVFESLRKNPIIISVGGSYKF
ncbi:MAG: porin family protein [Alistipes sp.]